MNAPMQAWMFVTGWTLIHFVWQGGLLAIATAAGLRLCRRRSSTTRYAIGCIGMTAMLATPALTAAVLREPASVALPTETGSDVVPGKAIHATAPQPAQAGSLRSANGAAGIRLGLDPWLPYVVWTWIAGVILLMARFAGGSWRVHRLSVAARAAAVSTWQSAGERLAARLRLDVRFRVVESGLVDTPSVIGFLRPVILMPVAVLSNLSTGQVEALLAHELAHIRRRDYAVNLLQTAAETLLFFHPAVWWVSSRIRVEREHCCDDVALDMCGEPTAYAAALAELASCRSREIALSVGAADGPLLRRIRRVLGAPETDEPRPASGLVVLAIGLMLTAGVAVQSTSQESFSPGPLANGEAAAVTVRQLAGTWLSRKTDHFDIYYPPDLDLHAERVGREAERAYERVSSDLKHNVAFQVPILLFPTAGDLQQSGQTSGSGRPLATSAADSGGDRILLAVDQPADQWYGRIVHEVAHVFAFDILPGTATPRWIMEGLAEYERAAWDPDDLVALRTAVRANAVPALSAGRSEDNSRDARQIGSLGHAAFDFIESRWGKSDMRQFLFAFRQSARVGADPFEGAFQVKRDEFDRAFEQYLRERFAVAADASLAGRFDYRATVHLEGEITSIRAPVEGGLACIELLVPIESGSSQRWGLECGSESAVDVVQGLKPGDRVIVTGPPARERAAHRMVVQSLERPSDGFTWRARSM
jgi:beta-lactamase regulating signal transducer with metallopeptidase domain